MRAALSQQSGSVSHTIVLGGDVNLRQTVCQVQGQGIRSWRVTLGTPTLSNVQLVVPGGMVASAAALPNAGIWQGTAPEAQGPTAHITWGIGNTTFEADVDWGWAGHSFVLTAEFVRVEMNALSIGGATGTTFKFPAQIGPAEAGSPPAQAPTLTKRFGTLGPGAVGSVGIPPFARRVMLFRETSPTPPETCEVDYTDGARTVFYRFDQITAAAVNGLSSSIFSVPTVIPAAAMRMSYRNGPGAVGIVQPAACFYLELG